MQAAVVPVPVQRIVQALGGEFSGDPAQAVIRLATLESATSADLSFLANPKYTAQLKNSLAGCVVLAPAMQQTALDWGKACIVTPNPYLYFARLTQWWSLEVLRVDNTEARIHPSAVVHSSAIVHKSAHIGALCVVGAGASIGAGTVLHPRVSVLRDCQIGARCVLHSGCVVGADGFGFAQDTDGTWVKIAQLGAVCIGNDVEIGANSCIDRGALEDTTLGDGVKLDNLVQIGHNVQIGAHTAIAGCAGVAGSAVIGQHCTIGGGAVVLGHLRLADHVHVSASSTVMKSILQAGTYSGVFPITDNASWEKNAASLRQLNELRKRVNAIGGKASKA